MLRLQTEFRRATADMNAYLQEAIAGRFIIRLFGQQKRMADDIQPILSRQFAATSRLAALQMSFPVIRQTLWAVTVSIVVWVAGPTGLVFSLGLSLGSLAALVDLIMRIFWPVEALSDQIHTLQEAMAGLRRINEFENEPLEEKQYDSESKPNSTILTIEGLTFGYGENPVLQDINLTIKEGTKLALAGRTGSGKTTLMNLIAGLYIPWHGNIRIGGVDPFHMPPQERRRWLGVVPQQACIFDSTVMDNISLRDPQIKREHVEEVIKMVGLHDEIQKLTEGYDTILGEGGVQLSYGQNQLLCLARALVTNPPIMLLDEVTAGMDTLTERHILDILKSVVKERTIITISHRISGLLDAQHVVMLHKGQIAEQGTPEELLNTQSMYSIYKTFEDLEWG